MEVDIENLIKQVEKKPIIYDTGSPEYHDRNLKKWLWEEIYSKLHTSWATCSNLDKITFAKEVQKKWNSLRDCFRRELNRQRNCPPGSSGKKKSKYKYYDLLIFLEPYTQIKSVESLENESSENPSHVNDSQYSEESEPIPRKKMRTEEHDMLVNEDQDFIENNHVEVMLGNDSSNFNGQNEDDKLFLLSLLPSFRNYTLEEKFALRIEIMQTILKFKQSRRNMGPSYTVKSGQRTRNNAREIEDDYLDDYESPSTSVKTHTVKVEVEDQ